MKSRLAVWLIGVLLPTTGWAFDYPVTFATTACNGDTGFINVDASRVFKIQTIACEQGGELKQALLRQENGTGYDAVTLTAEEAKALRDELRAYAAARRELLKNGSAVIVAD